MKRTIINFYKSKKSEDRIVFLVKKLCGLFSRHTVAKLTEVLSILLENKKEIAVESDEIKYYANKYLIVVNFSEDTKKYADTKITLFKFDGKNYEFKNVCYMNLSKHQLDIFNQLKS
jgi:hypothetical protein